MSAQQVEVQTLRGPGEGPPPSSIPLAQGRLSFRVKVALVWAGIFAVMAVFFAFAKFDWAWMRANFKFIATGVWVTILTAVAAIAIALVLALLGPLVASPGIRLHTESPASTPRSSEAPR